jgi:RNA polymerase sigma-70 factor (ECF subfamily)
MHAQRQVDEYVDYMINKYSNMVYRLAVARTRRKEDAEDVFQEVFLRLSKKMPEFENETHEKAWLIRVTINVAKNLLTSGWFKHTVRLEEEIKFEDNACAEVYYEVLSLPQKYRTVIHLFYYERLTIKEISGILKLNENTVKTRLSRAKEKLKSKLEGGFDHEGQ